MIGGIDADKSRGPRHVVSTLGAALAVVFGWLLFGPTVTGLQWLLLLPGALVAGAALTMLVAVPLRRLGGSGRRQRAIILPAAAVLVALMVASLTAIVAAAPAGGADGECPQPTEVRLLASGRQLALARELATAYVQWTADTHEGCPQVSIYSYAISAEQAITRLGSGWSGDALPEVGPRPDLWLPESGEEIEAVRGAAEGTDGDLIGLDAMTIAASPLVLAVAEAVAGGEDERQGRTWAELLRLADSRGWEPLRLHPDVSAADQLVVTALYGAYDSSAAAIAFARTVEPRIEHALDRGDYPLSDPAAFLCHHREHGEITVALLTTERAVVRLNRGDALGDDCPAPAGTATNRLLAHYPTDTLTVDYLLAALQWRGAGDTPQARAAADLRQWLATPDGKRALVNLGLRPAGEVLDGTALLAEDYGAIPDAHPHDPVSRPPSAAAVTRARAAYQAARRPGRVLIAVDLSGSMSRPVDSENTRYDLAQDGVAEVLRLLGSDDEFGLWVFPDQEGERELIPIGPANQPHQGQPRAEAATAQMDRLPPRGPTPLYRTIIDGVEAVGQAEDRVTALVVLTDGEDWQPPGQFDPATVDELAEIDGQAGVRVFVVAVGEASCLVEALAGVTARTGGSCVQADFESLTDQLVELFGLLWSGARDGS